MCLRRWGRAFEPLVFAGAWLSAFCPCSGVDGHQRAQSRCRENPDSIGV